MGKDNIPSLPSAHIRYKTGIVRFCPSIKNCPSVTSFRWSKNANIIDPKMTVYSCLLSGTVSLKIERTLHFWSFGHSLGV